MSSYFFILRIVHRYKSDRKAFSYFILRVMYGDKDKDLVVLALLPVMFVCTRKFPLLHVKSDQLPLTLFIHLSALTCHSGRV